MGAERRKAWRSGLVLDVQFEGGGMRGRTRIADLSVRGAYIETVNPLAVGSIFNVTFTLPNGTVIETRATVAHSQPHQGMGVRFDFLSQEQANTIRQFIHA